MTGPQQRRYVPIRRRCPYRKERWWDRWVRETGNEVPKEMQVQYFALSASKKRKKRKVMT